ncbi:acetoacetate--CoA ligase [Curvibacter sp. HBC28]|uniref:Acetoacetate--CoA ligase n=1 Tax=Curvibacter microcysteis TaxID=3026419 RepID=A0ABT5MBV5_9BURK|nr:acetoacetate--CoA ligase [Curvibacter sp. HBC28]MDD0813906.1 acetoacetate--CoA ligase [Curvibacter sp. HBC28]
MSTATRAPFRPQMTLYREWLQRERGLSFASYDALWRWSVTDLDAFWQSIWDYFELQSPTPHTAVLARNAMPGAVWFPGAQVNYVQQVFRHVQPAHAAGFSAWISRNEKGEQRELSWPELRRQVAALALHLRAQGVQRGDRVAAYLPNIPEATIAFLACASLGAVWSLCAPDMGTHAVLDRFKQIEPKVLIACDGVSYGGRDHDRLAVVAELRAALPTVQHLVLQGNLDPAATLPDATPLSAALARDDAATAAFEPEWLPFDHPLWIVYSSGTTGLPKPIVHGHGGTVVVALALKTLHNDIGCSYEANSWGERYHWYSSTGWVMWNAQVSGLLSGTTCVTYDGNPGGSRDKPDWATLWRFAADTGVTFFGAGAAFFANCMKAGIDLPSVGDLRAVRALGTTGSPLSEDVQRWGTAQFRAVHGLSPEDTRSPPGRPKAGGAPLGGSEAHEVASVGADIWWCNISGGTDFAGAFIGGNRELPQVPGQMQCRMLGSAVEAWNEQGQPVLGEVGELVCSQPIPSMPLFFWGDEGGRRYLSSYFDMYPAGHGRQPGGGDAGPEAGGVWRHGDWLRIGPDGGCVIYGRSDATINRHGLRMGTSELYSAVEALPEVLDSMVVDLEYLGRDSYMPLFVVLREGHTLDAAMRQRLNEAVKVALSPRFVPDEIFQVAEIPRTLTGKKQELPIKKLMLGQPIEKVVNRDAMANPACLDWYVALAAQRLAPAA